MKMLHYASLTIYLLPALAWAYISLDTLINQANVSHRCSERFCMISYDLDNPLSINQQYHQAGLYDQPQLDPCTRIGILNRTKMVQNV